MHRPVLALLAIASLSTLAFPFVQERVKQKKIEFESSHKNALRAWEAEEFGACLTSVREMMSAVTVRRVEVILAALPAAPEGFEITQESKPQEMMDKNPLAATFGGVVGSVVERHYRADDASIDVQITADSPLSQMFGMWVANPKMLGPDAELVKYGAHNAVLKKEGNRWTLQVLVDAKDVCEFRLTGRDDDFLLRFVNQAAVDRLAKVLAK